MLDGRALGRELPAAPVALEAHLPCQAQAPDLPRGRCGEREARVIGTHVGKEIGLRAREQGTGPAYCEAGGGVHEPELIDGTGQMQPQPDRSRREPVELDARGGSTQ